MQTKTLCFFTQSYPFGTGETFIENELNFIAPYFKKIYLFYHIKKECMRAIPDNVTLIYIEPHYTQSKKTILRGNYFLLFYLIFHELFFARQKKMFINKFRYNSSHIINCIYYSDQIKKNLNEEVLKSAKFYSYWFFNWNLSLSILKYRKIISKVFTRTHGFDLYEYNGKPNYLPLRKFCFQNTDKVFAISKTGSDYLKKIYPEYKEKISYSYLGTLDKGFNPIPPNNSFVHIVSCSNINEVKRLHLIIEIVKYIDVPVLWTHIGDGPLFESIKKQTLNIPDNIKVEFKGRMSQQHIFDFFETTPINFFINTSSSEGIPVSIMEAASFGIPIIATDVGGTNEIVNQTTGLLIEKEFDPKNVANYIMSSRNDYGSRSNIKAFWKNNFYAETNYSKFASAINY